MFLHKGKVYYPLEIKTIINGEQKELYDRNRRNKSYMYIALTNEKEKENG